MPHSRKWGAVTFLLALCGASSAIGTSGVRDDLARLERDVAQITSRGGSEKKGSPVVNHDADDATSSQSALGVGARAGKINDSFRRDMDSHSAQADISRERFDGGSRWTRPREDHPHGGETPAERIAKVDDKGNSEFDMANAKLQSKYRNIVDEVKKFAEKAGLPVEPCADMRCYQERMEQLSTPGSTLSVALAKINSNDGGEAFEEEHTMLASLMGYADTTREVVAKLQPGDECSGADQGGEAHKECMRSMDGLNMIKSINGYNTGTVNEMISKRIRGDEGSSTDQDPLLKHINERKEEMEAESSGGREVKAMLLEQGEGEGEGEGVGAVRNSNNGGRGGGGGRSSSASANTGMSNEAFKDRVWQKIREAATALPEIFYVGGGANLVNLNGAVEAAIDFETYEAALFVQGGTALGTDLVSVIGGNIMSGVAWKRSKSGESIEEYGGNGVSIELGGDVEVTLSVVAEIDANDRFVPEWDGVLKVGGDVGIDFGVPTVVSINVGASMASMIRRTRSCCATRRCLAWKIFNMPGNSALKAPAYAALAYYPPPSSARC